MENSADPDQMALSKTADLDLHCVLNRISPMDKDQLWTNSIKSHYHSAPGMTSVCGTNIHAVSPCYSN